MKKVSFFVFLLVIATTFHAQQFRAGFSAGLVTSDIDGADTRDSDNDFHKLGFTAGGLVNSPIGKKSTLQLELNFIQKGSTQPPDSNNNGYYKIAFSYIEIPVLIKRKIYFTIRKKPVNKIDLEAGLSIGRMITRTIVGNSNYNLPASSSLFNLTDVSVLFGADYNFSKNVYFCLRYSNSLIPAIRRNTPNFNYTYTFNHGNNMVFQFAFKFVFGGVEPAVTPVKDPGEE